MVSVLPPQYVNAPVELVYGVDLPAAVRLTAIRIYGLGWRHRYERTDPVSLEELMEICEVGRSTLYGHLAALGDKRVLRYTTVSVGSSRTFVFELLMGAPETAGRAPPGSSPEIWTDSALSVVVDSSLSSSVREKYVSHDKQRQQQHNHAVAVGGVCEGGAEQSRNLDAASGILDELGVLEPTRTELLELPHTSEAYLRRWLAWFEGQAGFGTGWVIQQIRAGIAAPEDRETREKRERQAYLAWGG